MRTRITPMTDEQNERAARVAKVIAKAMGDNFADAFKNKQRWTAKRGMSGGRFRDINEPFQSDYLAAADAATAVLAREFEADRVRIEALREALSKRGFMMTEPDRSESYPLARRLVIGFENGGDADDLMAMLLRAALKDTRHDA